LHRNESDQKSFGYIASADTMTPTLQLLFLVCGIISENDNMAPVVAMSRAIPGCQSRRYGEYQPNSCDKKRNACDARNPAPEWKKFLQKNEQC
jgi:hypothetical protein